jgi:hypothetical protein
MDLTKNAFWVIGDSFCDSRWSVFLTRYLQTKYPSPSVTKFYNYAEASMDTQTILDNWIKLLPHMSEGDAMVACVSDISRTRFPKHPEFVHTLPFEPNPYKGPKINSYFRYGPAGYDPANEPNHTRQLDVPFFDLSIFTKFAKLENSILSTKSYDNSKIDIIEALYKITPCHKKFIYTWVNADILKSENIYSKDWLTKNVFDGKWETQHDDWVNTNGESGKQNDFHLSDGCDNIMSDYFIKEFEL